MKAVYDACEKAEVDPPDEVINFFNGEEPDSRGVCHRSSNHGVEKRDELGGRARSLHSSEECSGHPFLQQLVTKNQGRDRMQWGH